MPLTYSPLSEAIVDLLRVAVFPGYAEDSVNMPELEKAVLAGLATGGGLPEVLVRITANASAIFSTPMYGHRAAKLLTAVQALVACPDSAAKLGASSPLP
jgi:hypothetical protein